MRQDWKTVRVFISSTFRDMHAERDYLINQVFPELRDWCAKRRLHLVDVDLRWGVTEEEATHGDVLEICLNELQRCRPFFIGLVGERYGHTLPEYNLPDESQYDWIREFEKGHSLTALEIYHGVLRDPRMMARAFFYFRDPKFIDDIPEEQRANFLAESDEAAKNLMKLKDEIRARHCPVYENYPCAYGGLDESGKVAVTGLEEFGLRVLSDLQVAISAEHPLEATSLDALEIERSYHETFIENSTKRFIGRRALLDQLTEYADGENTTPLVVTGDPGCGKSALLAKLAKEYAEKHAETFVLPHFIGASPGSTDIYRTISRLCRELKQKFNVDDDVPANYHELRQTFPKFLESAAASGKVLLILDALNQLDEGHFSHTVEWLPHSLPQRLSMIVSTLAGDCLDSLHERKPVPHETVIGVLTTEERREIVRRTLEEYRKKLDETPENNQMGLLLTKAESDNPLYLIVACEEMRVFGQFERVTEKIKTLANNVEELFEQVLGRLEALHGEWLVKDALSLIECSRHGLLESEMLELLARDADGQLPQAIWSRLYWSLKPYLHPPDEGDEGTLDFFHRQLSKAVRGKHLSGDGNEVTFHRRLAQHFRRKADPEDGQNWKGRSQRPFLELPFHMARGNTEELENILFDFAYAKAKSGMSLLPELISDYAEALRFLPIDYPSRRSLTIIEHTLRLAAPVIMEDPEQLASQLCGRLLINAPPLAMKFLSGAACCGKWLRPLRPTLAQPTGALRATFVGHQDAILSIAVTPNGELAVSGSRDGTLKTWDLKTNRELLTLRGHSGAVTGVALSADGRTAYSVSNDRTLRLWDLQTGLNLRVRRLAAEGGTPISISESGRRLLIGRIQRRRGGQVICANASIFDTGTLDEISIFHTSGSLHAIPKTNFVVVHLENQSVEIWDFETEEVQRTLLSHAHATVGTGATTIAHEAAKLICSPTEIVDFDGPCASIWDLQSGVCTHQLFGHADVVHAMAATATGLLISGSADHDLCVWDLHTGVEVERFEGHAGAVYSLSVTPDGERVLSGSADGTLKIWQLPHAVSRPVVRKWKPIGTTCVHESHGFVRPEDWDRRPIIQASARDSATEGSAGGWDYEFARLVPLREIFATEDIRQFRNRTTATSIPPQRVPDQHESPVQQIVIPVDGSLAVSASRESLRAWNLKTYCLYGAHRLGWQWKFYGQMAMTTDGKLAVRSAREHDDHRSELVIWEPQSGRVLNLWDAPWDPRHHVLAIVAVPDTHDVLVVTHCGVARWDLDNGTRTWFHDTGPDYATAIAVRKDGVVAALGTNNGRVRLVDAGSGAKLSEIDTKWDATNSLVVNETIVVAGSQVGGLAAWSAVDGKQRFQVDCNGPLSAIGLDPEQRCLTCILERCAQARSLDTGKVVGILDFGTTEGALSTVKPDRVFSWCQKSVRAHDLDEGWTSVAFTADGRITTCDGGTELVGAGDELGQVHWLRLEDGQVIRMMDPISYAASDADNLHARAQKARESGQSDTALELLRQEELIRRGLSDDQGLGACLGSQAYILVTDASASESEMEKACRLLKEDANICRRFGDSWKLEITLGNLAYVYVVLREPEAAMSALVECGHLAFERGDTEGLKRHQLFQQKLILESVEDLTLVQRLATLARQEALKQHQAEFAEEIKSFIAQIGG